MYLILSIIERKKKHTLNNSQYLYIIVNTSSSVHYTFHQETAYQVWLDRLTHLLREAQSHWLPFCFHSQLCKNDTRAAYQKTRMPWNWDEYFKCLRKLGHFQQAWTFDRITTITFKMEVTVSEPCDVIRVETALFQRITSLKWPLVPKSDAKQHPTTTTTRLLLLLLLPEIL